eukprot:2252979-Amphidinium_carterae.1
MANDQSATLGGVHFSVSLPTAAWMVTPLGTNTASFFRRRASPQAQHGNEIITNSWKYQAI